MTLGIATLLQLIYPRQFPLLALLYLQSFLQAYPAPLIVSVALLHEVLPEAFHSTVAEETGIYGGPDRFAQITERAAKLLLLAQHLSGLIER